MCECLRLVVVFCGVFMCGGVGVLWCFGLFVFFYICPKHYSANTYGPSIKDRPYYRQRVNDGCVNKQLFCFKDPSGWFFATELEDMVDCEPKKKRCRIETTQEYVGWAKFTDDLPCKIHVPYNCRNSIPGLSLKTNYECLREEIGLLSAGVGSCQPGAAASSVDDDWQGRDAKGKGWAKPGKRENGGGGGGAGGGWMNRAVDIIVPLLAGNSDAAIDSALKTCAKYDTCYWCVWRISET